MPAYDNTAVAAKLDLLADRLEIAQADRFRTLSYRKAAEAVRAWPEQVAALANDGRLTDIPTVGAKMAANIEQIVATGTFGALEEVAATFPVSLAQVTRVPGLGPKRTALLYEKLGVETLADLDEALSSGRVAALGGFGAKTAQKLTESLAGHRRRQERIPIGIALPSAEQLASDIATLPSVLHVECAGSVRRRRETVAGLDFVVATSDVEVASRDLATLPAVECVLDCSSGVFRAELHDGTCVVVYLTSPERYGAVLRYRTGDVRFNDALANLARNSGVDTGEAATFATEAQFFSAMGIREVPPEVREGDFALSEEGRQRVGTLVTLNDVRGDLQSHSVYTDGKTTLAENRAMAESLGYEYLAATDHAYALRMVGGLDTGDLARQWAEIDELNAEPGPRILKGIELNIGPHGELDYEDDVLARFDIVLASLHSGWDEDEATVTSRALRAIEHPLVDIIAHPTGRVIGRRDPLRLNIPAVLEAAGDTGTIMEINSYPDRLDLSAEHILLARRCGVRFSLGTDAHHADQFRFMRYGVAQARRGWVTPDELINSRPWEEARTWLKRARA